MSLKVIKAFELANKYHTGHFRKDGVTPYIGHCVEAVLRAEDYECYDDNVLCALFLHDVFEELIAHKQEALVEQVTLEIETFLGADVLRMVSALTRWPGTSKVDYMKAVADKDFDILICKAIDRLCNVRSFYLKGLQGGDKDAFEYAQIYSIAAVPLYKAFLVKAKEEGQDIYYSKLIEHVNLLLAQKFEFLKNI